MESSTSTFFQFWDITWWRILSSSPQNLVPRRTCICTFDAPSVPNLRYHGGHRKYIVHPMLRVQQAEDACRNRTTLTTHLTCAHYALAFAFAGSCFLEQVSYWLPHDERTGNWSGEFCLKDTRSNRSPTFLSPLQRNFQSSRLPRGQKIKFQLNSFAHETECYARKEILSSLYTKWQEEKSGNPMQGRRNYLPLHCVFWMKKKARNKWFHFLSSFFYVFSHMSFLSDVLKWFSFAVPEWLLCVVRISQDMTQQWPPVFCILCCDLHALHSVRALIVPLVALESVSLHVSEGVDDVCAMFQGDVLRGEAPMTRSVLGPVRVIANPSVVADNCKRRQRGFFEMLGKNGLQLYAFWTKVGKDISWLFFWNQSFCLFLAAELRKVYRLVQQVGNKSVWLVSLVSLLCFASLQQFFLNFCRFAPRHSIQKLVGIPCS